MVVSKELLSLMLFHHKFGMPENAYPALLPSDLMDFRVKFLEEELDEIREAYEAGDLAKVADGLIDLVYVAIGTAELMGVPWDACWNEVQAANMAKRRALSASESKRFSTFDVVKPEGWVPPDLDNVIKLFMGNGLHNDRRATILRSGHQLPE